VKSLVVDVFVHVSLILQQLDDLVIAVPGPVVGGEHDLCLISVQPPGLVQALSPGERISDLRSAEGEDVVQCSHAVFRHEECLVVREPDVHLHGSLGIGAVLELHIDPVDGQVLAGLCDINGWGYEGSSPRRRIFAQAVIDEALCIMGKKDAVHVLGPPLHGRAGIDIFADGVLHESGWCYYLDLSGSHLFIGYYPFHSLVVVCMGMRIDHSFNRIIPQSPVHQGHCRPGGLNCNHGIYDNPAGIALDQAHRCNVVSSDLIDSRDDLE